MNYLRQKQKNNERLVKAVAYKSIQQWVFRSAYNRSLIYFFLRECKKPEPCPAEGEIIVPLTVWNKIQELANKPAVTHIDTVYLPGKIVYISVPLPSPEIDPADTTIKVYNDSLVRKDINVSYDFKIKGKLLNRKWHYTPIMTQITRVDTIYVPSIVEIEKEVSMPQNGLYAYGIAGGNANSFLFGGGVDFITKKNTEIGYLYQRYGANNFHSVKLGIKIFNKK